MAKKYTCSYLPGKASAATRMSRIPPQDEEGGRKVLEPADDATHEDQEESGICGSTYIKAKRRSQFEGGRPLPRNPCGHGVDKIAKNSSV